MTQQQPFLAAAEIKKHQQPVLSDAEGFLAAVLH